MIKNITLAFSIIFLFLTKDNKAQMAVSISGSLNNPCDTCVNLSAIVTGGSPPYSYTWFINNEPFGTGQNVVYCNKFPYSFSSDSLVVQVVDANSQQSSIGEWPATWMSSNISDIDYCIVTFDSITGKNMLVWEESNTYAASYNIYKKNTSSAWEVIANIPVSSISIYIDTASSPSVATEWYNLSPVDSCGFQTPWDWGIATNTIHLSINAGIPPTWNLIWNATQGFPIIKYRIWRGTTTSGPAVIDSVSNSVFAYTDVTAPLNASSYFIEAVSSADCSPSFKKTRATSYTTSLSNIAHTNISGLYNNNSMAMASVSPNPLSNHTVFRIDIPLKQATLTIYNSLGEIVDQLTQLNGNSVNFSPGKLCGGLYFAVIMQDNQTIYSGRLVLQGSD